MGKGRVSVPGKNARKGWLGKRRPSSLSVVYLTIFFPIIYLISMFCVPEAEFLTGGKL